MSGGGSTRAGGGSASRALSDRSVGDGAGSARRGGTGWLSVWLGAAGAIESAFCVLAIRDQIAPPTINLDDPEHETPIDLVPHKAKEKKLRYALSNSFGFGGTNASLIVKASEG